MSTAQIKEKLHKYINQGDERFLKVVYAMVKAYSDEENIGRITVDQYNKEIEEAEAEIDDGRGISHKDLKREMKEW